jgi:glycosyltransferase involved in cell wall biosynthesis
MSSALVLVAFTIPKFRSTQTLFWYTHKGPESLLKKIILNLATKVSNKIITASQNSFPIKSDKVTPIGHAIDYDSFYKKQISTKSKNFIIISRISRSKNIELSIQGFLKSCYGKTNELRIIGGTITDDDILYQSNLKDKYKNYSNIKFLGTIPHAELGESIKDVGFHINNTSEGFYDKSVLETMASGIINFYTNSDYDRNVHPKYIKHLKFNSTESDLSEKINLISNFDDDILLDLIKFSQKRVSEESLSNLHERILKVI